MTNSHRRLAQRVVSLFVLLAVVAASTVPAFAQRRRNPRLRRTTRTTTARTSTPARPLYTIPADTVIRVRMNQEMSSKSARVGDRFSTSVTEPVYAGSGVEVIPVGATVWGRVTSVRKAGRRTPGNISVSFNQVQLPNGATHAINGSLTSLQTDDVNADNEGGV
ncbi:MAG TPA: hypothetical protein VGV38_02875, partial [Pyrinomonadaceae bacterium]|nr:hypothetical protein [Pyrinomonadaceae bacterium]